MIFNQQERRKIVQIAADKIVPNPYQPRKIFSEEELEGLADSIAVNGLLQPISVRRNGAVYEIIAGERRWRACVKAEMKVIPCIIQECTESQSAVLAILENLQRQDLHIFEEAEGIQRLIDDWGVTQEEAARRLGKSQSSIANKLRLLRLTPPERQKIEKAGLTERHARALLRINDTQMREKLLDLIIEKGLNVQQTDRLIEEQCHQKKKKEKKRTFIAKDIRIFFNTIDHAIQTMRQAGILAQADQKDMGEYLEYTVRIPKQETGGKKPA
jgi:ParB family chromosome partitioning protein